MTEIAKLNKLLKEQILSSINRDQATGVFKMGDDFEDVCKEILRSDTVSGILIGQVHIMMQTGFDNFVLAVAKLQASAAAAGSSNGRMHEIIDVNMRIFGTPLAMFYWGMKIGRKLQHDEDEVIKQYETPTDTKNLQSFFDACVKLASEATAAGNAPIHPVEIMDEARKVDSTL